MHIHIFTTGGSIDKTYSTQESDFIVGDPQIDTLLAEVGVSFTHTLEPLMKKDSLAITDADRALIVERVSASPRTHILITHGTDTMPETGRALLLARLNKTIVLTGAMQPMAFKVTDAVFNLGCALMSVQHLPVGVYIVMNGQAFTADNVKKNLQANRFEAL